MNENNDPHAQQDDTNLNEQVAQPQQGPTPAVGDTTNEMVLQAGFSPEVEQPTGAGASAPMPQPTDTNSFSNETLSTPPKKSKKKIVLGFVIAIVALLLLGGSAMAFTIYQQPENVLLNAARNALSSKNVRAKTVITSDFVYDIDGKTLAFEKISFETGSERSPRFDTNAEISVKYDGNMITLKGDVLATESGEIYYRVSNIKDTLQKIMPPEIEISAKADEQLSKIDGMWAKYTLEELKNDLPDYGEVVQCTLDVYKKYNNDQQAIRQLADVYGVHQFVVTKGDPISKDGNYGYVVDIDKQKAESFSKAAKDTTIVKELNACDKNDDPVIGGAPANAYDAYDELYNPNNTEGPKTVTTVWVSKWGHVIRAVDTKTIGIEGEEGKTFTISSHTDVSFEQGVTTGAPSDPLSLKDWIDFAVKFVQELTMSETTEVSTGIDVVKDAN